MAPSTQSHKKSSKSSTGPLVNIVTECFRKDNRVAIPRLVSFEISWLYGDGILSGVVWVAPRGKVVDVFAAKPCWYHCVDENLKCDHGWYRKFALYEMTPAQLDKVRGYATLRALTGVGPFQCCHLLGMKLSPTQEEYLLMAQFQDMLDPHALTKVRDSVSVNAKMFHTGQLYGWFQR